MNRLHSLLTLLLTASGLCCIAHSNTFSQTIAIDTNITTFSKLMTTLIVFTASEKPTIRTEPSLEGQYTLTFEGGKGSLRFDKPMSIGRYTITLSIGKTTTKTQWNVLPTTLDSAVMRRLIGTYFYSGKRLTLKSKLPTAAAHLPLDQFKIRYRFGTNSKAIDSPYSPAWVGPYIPASTNRLSIAVVWQYPPTGEFLPLFHYETVAKQVPPQIFCDSTTVVRADTSTSLLATSGFDLNLNGIRIDTLAISADSNGRNPINAAFSDIIVNPPAIDYNSPDTQLRVYVGDVPDFTSIWVATGTAFTITKSLYNATTGTLALTIAVRDLPPSNYIEPRTIRGTVAIKLTAKITNPVTDEKAQTSLSCVIPIHIVYQPLAVGSTKTLKYPSLSSWMARSLAHRSILCKDCSDDAVRNMAWRVKSPALRKEVYDYLLRLGRKLPQYSPNTSTPLVLGGTAKRNGAFDLKTLRFGNEVVTYYDITKKMPDSLRRTLSKPISPQGKRLYPLEALSAKMQVQEHTLARNLAHASCLYESKEVLRNIDNYSYAGYALYEGDSAITQRMRERITPLYPPRTPSLEEAERECANTAKIIELASQRKAIPELTTYQDGDSWACEFIKNYYQDVARFIRIGRVYIIADLSKAEPHIVGMVSTQAPIGLLKTDPDFLKNALNGPIASGVFDAIDLLQFPTQEYEGIDRIPVKGSITSTSARNLYEYCLEGLRRNTFIDRTSEVFPFPVARHKRNGH